MRATVYRDEYKKMPVHGGQLPNQSRFSATISLEKRGHTFVLPRGSITQSELLFCYNITGKPGSYTRTFMGVNPPIRAVVQLQYHWKNGVIHLYFHGGQSPNQSCWSVTISLENGVIHSYFHGGQLPNQSRFSATISLEKRGHTFVLSWGSITVIITLKPLVKVMD